jgi:hypothetical protein
MSETIGFGTRLAAQAHLSIFKVARMTLERPSRSPMLLLLCLIDIYDDRIYFSYFHCILFTLHHCCRWLLSLIQLCKDERSVAFLLP